MPGKRLRLACFPCLKEWSLDFPPITSLKIHVVAGLDPIGVTAAVDVGATDPSLLQVTAIRLGSPLKLRQSGVGTARRQRHFYSATCLDRDI